MNTKHVTSKTEWAKRGYKVAKGETPCSLCLAINKITAYHFSQVLPIRGNKALNRRLKSNYEVYKQRGI